MALFSRHSKKNLETCHPQIQSVLFEVIKNVDSTVYQGHRNKQEQNRMVEEGKSQLRWPNSEHNAQPSQAVDIAPWIPGIGIPWENREAFAYLGGWVMAEAHKQGVNLRWGNDWDQDGVLISLDDDESFYDPGHFELVGT